MRRDAVWLWQPDQDLPECEVLNGVLPLIGERVLICLQDVHPVLYGLA